MNVGLAKAVCAELNEKRPAGLRYAAFVAVDGLTFFHPKDRTGVCMTPSSVEKVKTARFLITSSPFHRSADTLAVAAAARSRLQG